MDNSDVFEALPATLDAAAVSVSAHPDPDISEGVEVTVRKPDSWGKTKVFAVHQDMAFAQRVADTATTPVPSLASADHDHTLSVNTATVRLVARQFDILCERPVALVAERTGTAHTDDPAADTVDTLVVYPRPRQVRGTLSMF